MFRQKKGYFKKIFYIRTHEANMHSSNTLEDSENSKIIKYVIIN